MADAFARRTGLFAKRDTSAYDWIIIHTLFSAEWARCEIPSVRPNHVPGRQSLLTSTQRYLPNCALFNPACRHKTGRGLSWLSVREILQKDDGNYGDIWVCLKSKHIPSTLWICFRASIEPTFGSYHNKLAGTSHNTCFSLILSNTYTFQSYHLGFSAWQTRTSPRGGINWGDKFATCDVHPFIS